MSGNDVRHPVIPDGGWGWIVVIGAFINHMITHGVFFSIGIIFTSLQEALNGSKAEVAWIVSIEIGSGFLSGPVTGFLISRYGARVVSVAGSILAAGGYILSVFASNIIILYGTMGLISGLGLGMIIIPAIVIVNEYFHKHRALAAGISMAGTGCGAFLFNPLLSWLMEKYGWRGCILVLSAIVMNSAPAGLLYRPVLHFKQTESHTSKNTLSENKLTNGGSRFYTSNHEFSTEITKNGDTKPLYNSHNGVIELIYDNNEEREDSIDPLLRESKNTGKSDVVVTGCDLQEHKPEVKTKDQKTRLLGQFSLFKDAVFTMSVLAHFLFIFGFYVPFVYLPDKSKQEGLGESSTVWVLSTMGISSIFGRILFGYIADRPGVNRLMLYTSGFLISGVVTLSFPVYNRLWMMFSYAVVYGIFTGMVLGLFPVVLIDLLGLEVFPSTFGISCLLRGMASLLGSPFADFQYRIAWGVNGCPVIFAALKIHEHSIRNMQNTEETEIRRLPYYRTIVKSFINQSTDGTKGQEIEDTKQHKRSILINTNK